jgi:hypothetical protein
MRVHKNFLFNLWRQCFLPIGVGCVLSMFMVSCLSSYGVMPRVSTVKNNYPQIIKDNIHLISGVTFPLLGTDPAPDGSLLGISTPSIVEPP